MTTAAPQQPCGYNSEEYRLRWTVVTVVPAMPQGIRFAFYLCLLYFSLVSISTASGPWTPFSYVNFSFDLWTQKCKGPLQASDGDILSFSLIFFFSSWDEQVT
ncbi:hypothetical protein QX201_001358 [Fusarium graminearum]